MEWKAGDWYFYVLWYQKYTLSPLIVLAQNGKCLRQVFRYSTQLRGVAPRKNQWSDSTGKQPETRRSFKTNDSLFSNSLGISCGEPLEYDFTPQTKVLLCGSQWFLNNLKHQTAPFHCVNALERLRMYPNEENTILNSTSQWCLNVRKHQSKWNMIHYWKKKDNVSKALKVKYNTAREINQK